MELAFNLVRRTEKRRIGVLGLSFKAGTDDLRESPIVVLIETLIGKGYKLSVYDEEVALAKLVGANRRYIEQTIPHISSLMLSSPQDVIQTSEVVLISKRHLRFEKLLQTTRMDERSLTWCALSRNPLKGQSSTKGFVGKRAGGVRSIVPKLMTKPEVRQSGIVDVTLGKDVTIVQPVNLYGCAIGDETFIGPFVEIQKGATIGKRCRIQSHSFICDLVTIGDDCFISHGAMFINDLFVTGGPAGKPELWRQTKLGNHVSVGTNATILPVTICDQVVIGAGAVVTKDIVEPGIYAGNPARLLRRL